MKSYVLAFGLLLSLLFLPGHAEARGIPVVYNTGQDVFETGPLPAPFDQIPELQGYQAGYLCDITGILWSYFSVRNCKPVAFKDTSYSDEPELVAAISAKYPEASMKRGLWEHYGWMLMAAVIVLGGLYWLYETVTGKSDEESESGSEATKTAGESPADSE